ncbi:MAG: NAD+ synthase [Promethearchaeota archaeon]|jgi:NAD+ synthase
MRKLDYDRIISDIQEWIKDYCKSANAEGIVVGISGGIDSAVTSTLCANALGKDAVIGLGLPCISNPKDLIDAKLLAVQLGIEFLIFDLSSVYEEIIQITANSFESNNLATANLKARLRMVAWYFTAQSKGTYIIGGTGNRTELAIGYFTKYGDGGVDIEPIGGLYKCEVREIARLLKVPESIINKPPSAGLWEGQTDEGEIGITYDVIDEILYRIDNNLNLNNLKKSDVDKVKKMMKTSQHKLNIPPAYEILKE